MSRTFDLYAPDFPHGTPDGYRLGCHGSLCGSVMTCRDVYTRYQGDWGFKKQIDAGVPVAEIIRAEDARRAEMVAADRAAAKAAHLQDAKAARGALGARSKIEKLHAEGLNDPQIAEALGLNRTYVARLRRELGLSAHRAPRVVTANGAADRTEDVTRLIGEGKSDQDVAALLGMSRSWVSKVRRRAGIDGNGKGTVAPEILRLHGEGLSNREIGERVGVGAEWVSKVISNAGMRANRAEYPKRAGVPMERGRAAREAVATGHAEGLSDPEIAARSGMRVAHVALVRRKLGLPLIRYEKRRPVEAEPAPAIVVKNHAPAVLVHGTVEMYDAGCRKGSECPNRPMTCTVARLEQDRAQRHAAVAEVTG